jgi:hypothetical protein
MVRDKNTSNADAWSIVQRLPVASFVHRLVQKSETRVRESEITREIPQKLKHVNRKPIGAKTVHRPSLTFRPTLRLVNQTKNSLYVVGCTQSLKKQ